MGKDNLETLTAQCKECIKKYSKRAAKASFLPIVSIPLVHGLCVAMQTEMNKIFGVGAAKDERHSNIALGVLATPFMAVPLLGAIPAAAYVQTVGESYMKALIEMYDN